MEKRKKEKCPKCKKMRGLVHDFGDSKMCALCYWVRPCEEPPPETIFAVIKPVTRKSPPSDDLGQ